MLYTCLYMCIYEYVCVDICIYVHCIHLCISSVWKFHVLCCDNVPQHIMSFYIHILAFIISPTDFWFYSCVRCLLSHINLLQSYSQRIHIVYDCMFTKTFGIHPWFSLSSTSSQINILCDRFLFKLIWRSHVTPLAAFI